MDTIEGDHPLGTLILYGAPPFEQKVDTDALKKPTSPPANGITRKSPVAVKPILATYI